jgi:hypothetical protein
LRWMRRVVLGALTAGIVLTVIAGASFASHVTAQTGYGAPQVLGDTFITPKTVGSSHLGFWLGLLIALAVIAATGFIGWRRTHAAET